MVAVTWLKRQMVRELPSILVGGKARVLYPGNDTSFLDPAVILYMCLPQVLHYLAMQKPADLARHLLPCVIHAAVLKVKEEGKYPNLLVISLFSK